VVVKMTIVLVVVHQSLSSRGFMVFQIYPIWEFMHLSPNMLILWVLQLSIPWLWNLGIQVAKISDGTKMLALVAEQNVGMSRAVEIADVAAAAAAEAVRCLQNLSVSRVPDQTLALPIASVPLAPFRSSSPATTVADRPTVDSTIPMSGGKVIPDRIIHGISKATTAFEKKGHQ